MGTGGDVIEERQDMCIFEFAITRCWNRDFSIFLRER